MSLAAQDPAQGQITAYAAFVFQLMRRTKHALYDPIALRREVQRFVSVEKHPRCANIENWLR